MRRNICRMALLVMGLGVFNGPQANVNDARSLRFYHTHTRESLELTYYTQGAYDTDALRTARRFMADWRDGQQTDLDPALLDILWQIEQETGHSDTWEIISAYRSPQTNEMLRSRSSGVAKKQPTRPWQRH